MLKQPLPAWLKNREERKKQLLKLAESGVSRAVIRLVTGWSNNQMASAANRAGFSFNTFQTVELGLMKKPLIDAGFSEEVIDGAMRKIAPEILAPAESKTTQGRHRPKSEKRTASKKTVGTKRAALPPQDQAVQADHPVVQEITKKSSTRATTTRLSKSENAIAWPTDAEVAAQYARDLVAEVALQETGDRASVRPKSR